MQREELERLELLQAVRSDAFKTIARRSMNQWRVLMGVKRGQLDRDTYRFLELVADYYGDDSEGVDECRFVGLEPPNHADDIVDWIQNAPPFDELDTMRFNHFGQQHLRKRKNPYETRLSRYRRRRKR